MPAPKYKDYEQDVILCKSIQNLHPYEVHLPDLPTDKTKIINYGKPIEEQVFQRVRMPEKLVRIDNSVRTGALTREEAVAEIDKEPELYEFVEMLWRKRLGLEHEFQYINGHPIWIPPSYWFYLNFWQIPKVRHERPEFRCDFYHYCTDLWFFTWWDLCVMTNPFCWGGIWFTQRQVGKSYIAHCIGYNIVSVDYETNAGMQSKTDLDAAKVYDKCLVRPWQELPFFFKPRCSNSSHPKGEGLKFTNPSQKGKDQSVTYEDEPIKGFFNYKASTEGAYDGDTLDFYITDEGGKTLEADVYARWTVVKEALRRRGGKGLFVTTVEEMDKGGGRNFFRIWEDSDRSPIKRSGQSHIKVDENGETTSGLWPWFSPSYCNEHFNQYGIAIVDKITEKEKAYLKSVAAEKKIRYWWLCGMDAVNKEINNNKDPLKQQEVIRKKPRNIVEAFESGLIYSYFNREILKKNLEKHFHGYTHEEMEYMKFGYFDWVNEFGGDVKFVELPMQDARCHISYLLPDDQANKKIPLGGGKYRPNNTALFRSGADPFKYDTPDVKNPSRMSDGTQHIYMYFDPKVDGNKDRSLWRSNNIIYEYRFRPVKKDDLFEDYLKACIYYGCKLYPERNNDDVLDYFKRHGFEHYIQLAFKVKANLGVGIHYSQDTVGGDITGAHTIQKMFRHVADWVINDAAACPFYRTVRDVLEVERENLNPYDLFVSLSYTLMASYEGEISNLQNAHDNEAVQVTLKDIQEAIGFEPSFT